MSPRIKECATTLAILAFLSATLALAEDFTTVRGKSYKDATILRVEANGIVLKTKTGISKVYFVELPPDVQQRFRPAPAKTPEIGPIKLTGRAALMANFGGIIKYAIAGIAIIAGLVFLIARRRSQ